MNANGKMFDALRSSNDKCLKNALKAALEEGADVDAKDASGATALMWAANRGSADCVRMRLSAGADVDAKDRAGMAALMLAVASGACDCVGALLAAGADPAAKRLDGSVAEDISAEGSECRAMLVAARQVRELDAAVGNAGAFARKATL